MEVGPVAAVDAEDDEERAVGQELHRVLVRPSSDHGLSAALSRYVYEKPSSELYSTTLVASVFFMSLKATMAVWR